MSDGQKRGGSDEGFKGFSFAFTALDSRAGQSTSAEEKRELAAVSEVTASQGGEAPSASFKGFSFAFTALNSPASVGQSEPGPQAPVGANAASPPLSLAFAVGGTLPTASAITTASLDNAVGSSFFEGASARSFNDVRPFDPAECYSPPKTWPLPHPSSHSIPIRSWKAQVFSGGDPCPPWTRALATNPNYPIPMMGETKSPSDASHDSLDVALFSRCRAELDLKPTTVTGEPHAFTVSFTEWEPAKMYFAFQVERALKCLGKMTKLERMEALSYELIDGLPEGKRPQFRPGPCHFSTMVHVAAYRCDVPTLKALVELTGPAVLCVQNGMGSSPLVEAILSPLCNSSETVKYLLDETPDDVLIEADFLGNSLLSLAVGSRRLAHVEAVVNRHPPTDWRFLSEAVCQLKYHIWEAGEAHGAWQRSPLSSYCHCVSVCA